MRNIRSEFYKILTGYGFYLCIAFTAVLCFSAHIYIDPVNNDRYSVLMFLRSFDREFMLNDACFCSFSVMLKGAGSWLSMFIPIISAFAFVPLVCDEYEARSVRFEIFRSSKLSYRASRFVTAFICGGVAVTAGFAIYTALVYMLFPGISEYGAEKREMFEQMYSYAFPEIIRGKYHIAVVKKLLAIFFYGALSAVPAITLTSLVRNKYLAMCIPFFMKYAADQTCVKLQSQALSDLENADEKLLKLSSVISPDSLAYFSELGENKRAVMIYSLALAAAAMAAYLIIHGRRLDSGE